MKRILLLTLLICAFIAAAGCAKKTPPPITEITMATTTSTDNSGLLKTLLPRFKEQNGITVKVIAVGTGKAIRHGKNGDVDVILVHARAAEEKFVADGFGVKRIPVMQNDFILIGPAADPAGIRGEQDVAAALQKIAAAQAPFISRADDSGTHKKEKFLWQAAEITPEGEWYNAAGQGMGAVLVMANEKQAYTLTDRGTYLAYLATIDSTILCAGDQRLMNPYAVIAVNPAKHSHVKSAAVDQFIAFLTGTEGQQLIGNFRINGKQLFIPDAE